MRKYTLLVSLVVVLVLASVAYAEEYSHSLKSGITTFTIKANHPKKAILYPESRNVITAYSTVCIKGITVSHLSRTFTTSYTRNLLYKIPPRQDVCYFAVAAASSTHIGQIVVDIK